ncbi:MAG: ABC transporter permease subunit [Deltaproteobacteria bacterium]|nr:ABC transporter permease subunit [Deltaproteobacteria bacterium]
MIRVFAVALDTVREASSRGWILALFAGISLSLVSLGFGLEMQVVDGALAASKLFGETLGADQIVAVDVALGYVYLAAGYVIFYGGLSFGILSSADFAPSLLEPGRIEHMLSLPVRRSELLVGTYLGVLAVSALAVIYASVGLSGILGLKTGVWSMRLVPAALFGTLSFAAIYAVMMTAALLVRSAALSAVAGLMVFVGGIVASFVDQIAPMFSPGLSRNAFTVISALLPPIATIAQAAATLASGKLELTFELVSRLIGLVVFGGAVLSAGIARFSRMDF